MAKGTKVARVCTCCGRAYRGFLSDVGRGWGKVCSKRCADLARLREVVAERNRSMRIARTPAPPLLRHGKQHMAAGRLQDIETTAELRTSGPEFQFNEDGST